jgi:hypothetical protein
MNKKLMTFGIVALLAIAVATAIVVYGSVNIDVSVAEALTVTSLPTPTFMNFPGETAVQTITVLNNAAVPLDTVLSYT